MDLDLINRRYEAMFAKYNPARPLLGELKKHIIARAQDTPDLFRADAKFFLLLNADQMVIRALSDKSLMNDQGDALDPLTSEDVLRSQVFSSVDLIIDDLKEKYQRPVSAHCVIQSIDENWKPINALLGWA